MFRVKICGVTNVDDALISADAGADAVGLNFYSSSPRYCPPATARDIVRSLPAGIVRVGVFVNATADEIRSTAETVGLDLVQLHGDEPPELLRAIRPLAVMRAFRLGIADLAVDEYLRNCHRLMCAPRMVLIDAFKADQYGGTGIVLGATEVTKARRMLGGVPLVLAGGLTPTNVAAAIAAVGPWAVDTASGVEQAPGRKSEPLVRAFVTAAREAFARLAQRKQVPAQE